MFAGDQVCPSRCVLDKTFCLGFSATEFLFAVLHTAPGGQRRFSEARWPGPDSREFLGRGLSFFRVRRGRFCRGAAAA